jgi:hypothetical protein
MTAFYILYHATTDMTAVYILYHATTDKPFMTKFLHYAIVLQSTIQSIALTLTSTSTLAIQL